jgi:transposase
VGIYTAVSVALKYRLTPSPKQLMADFGMSHATAYRWVSAFKAARGEEA